MLPTGKRFKKSDSGGLFIEVAPNGVKTWKIAYRHDGRQYSKVLGMYPAVSLDQARRMRDHAKGVLNQGKNPFPKPEKTSRANALPVVDETWGAVAKEYRDRRVLQGAAPMTIKKMEIMIGKTMYGIGSTPVREIRPIDLLPILRLEEANGHFETAVRLRTLISQIFRYAVATGRAEKDQARDLKGAIMPPKRKHHAGLIQKEKVGGLMRAISGYSDNPVFRTALLVLAYTFVRPGELRLARWTEFDEDQWIIPAERMKKKRKHVVPLSRQARTCLIKLRPAVLGSEWVFPQRHNLKRPMSDGTLNSTLRRLGFSSSEHVPHGFRTTASTNLNEAGWNSDWIEAQLAHVPSDSVRSAYNAAQYLEGRREMMQWWADWLDGAQGDANGPYA